MSFISQLKIDQNQVIDDKKAVNFLMKIFQTSCFDVVNQKTSLMISSTTSLEGQYWDCELMSNKKPTYEGESKDDWNAL